MTTRATKQAKTGPEIRDLDGDGRRYALSVDGVIRFTGSREDCENRRRILAPDSTRDYQNHRLGAILRVLLLAALAGLAVPRGTEAASSINTALPVQGQPYNAAPIRQNFTAASNDILALQRMNAGATAPASPTLGMLWLETPVGETDYALKIWNDRLSAWVQIATLDSLNGLWITNVGGGLPTTLLTADTVDLGSVPNMVLTVTGAGPVYSFGSTAPAGIVKVLIFSGATQLIYNATSMILPGAANLTTAANDIAIVTSLGSGNWQALYFQGATLSVQQGGTGRATLTQYSVLLGAGTSPVNFAAPGTSGYPLLSTGASSNPAFGQLDLNGAGTTGTLAVNRGGTALATLTAHALIIGNGTGTPALLTPGLANLPLVSNGATLDPSYQVLPVSGGGTGASIIALYSVVAGGGAGPFTGVAPGTAGYPLLSTGAAAYPAFGQLNLAGAGVTGLLPLVNLPFTIPTASLIGGTGSNFAGVTVGLNLTFGGGTLAVDANPTFNAVAVTNDITAGGNAAITGGLAITGALSAAGAVSFPGTTTLGTLGVTGNASVTGTATLGTLGVTGNASINGNATVSGSQTVSTNLSVSGLTTSATLTVTGAANFSSTIGVTGTASMLGNTVLTGITVTPGGLQPVCINVATKRLYEGAAGAC